jgi:hypothetical protein
MIDKNKAKCAHCGKFIFEIDKFKKDMKEFGKDAAGLWTSLIASHGNPAAFPVVLAQFDDINQKLERESYAKDNTAGYIDDGDKAFCCQDHYDEYYSS